MKKNIYRLPRRAGLINQTTTSRNDKGGFTLIELLVAMGIMAVLTGMAIFNFNQSRIRSRDVQRKNDLKQLQNALELYKNDNNAYPPELDFQSTLITPSYIKAELKDPRASEWVDYSYQLIDTKNYYLQACLENPADSAKTSDEAKCVLFDAVNKCKCGSASSLTGVMYIVSQP